MNIGFIPSLNGLGHLRRLISVAHEVKKLGCEVTFVISDQYKIEDKFLAAIKEKEFKFHISSTPDYRDGPFVQRSEKRAGTLGVEKLLNALDLVIADTVTWPIQIYDKVIFLGQFTWELYYAKVSRLTDKHISTTFPLYKALKVYGMHKFAWPEIASLPNFTPLPILDYWSLRDRLITRKKSLGIIKSGIYDKYIDGIRSSVNLIDVSAPEDYFARGGVFPTGILCRPGLGAISEILTLKSVPILFQSDNFELSRNCKTVIENGWGVLLKNKGSINYDILTDKVTTMREQIQFPQTITSARLARAILNGEDI